jgi:hypothetical protein
MNISSVIKYEVLRVCGGPLNQPYNLPDATPLGYLGYDEDEKMCKILEKRLQSVAIEYNTGRIIRNSLLTPNLTVSQCIELVECD